MCVPGVAREGGQLSSFGLVILNFTNIVILKTLVLVLPFSSATKIIAPFRRTLFASASTIYIAKLIIRSANDC